MKPQGSLYFMYICILFQDIKEMFLILKVESGELFLVNRVIMSCLKKKVYLLLAELKIQSFIL